MKILHTLKIRLICICLSLVLCISLVVSNTHKVQAVVPAVAAVAVVVAAAAACGIVVTQNFIKQVTDGSSALNQDFEDEYHTTITDYVMDNVIQFPTGGSGGNSRVKTFIKASVASIIIGFLANYFSDSKYKQEQNENGNIDLVYSNTMSYDEMFDFMYENINYDGALTPYHNSVDTGLVFFTDKSSPSYSSSRNDRHNLKWIRLIKIDYIPTSNGEYYRDCYGYICHTNYSRYNNCIQIFFTYNDKLRSYWNYAVNFISNDYCGFNDNYNDKFGNYTYLTEPIYNTDCNSYIDDLQNKEKVAELKPDNIVTNDSYYDDNVKTHYVPTPTPELYPDIPPDEFPDFEPDTEYLPVNIPDIQPEDLPNIEPSDFPDSEPNIIFDPEYEYDPQPEPEPSPDPEPEPQPEPEPSPDPEPEPQPDPEPDEFFTEGLSDKFPFCIPFDLIEFIEVLNADPETPHFEIPIKLDKPHIEYTMVIDLGLFDGIASLLRKLELLVFCVGLILLTRNIIKG